LATELKKGVIFLEVSGSLSPKYKGITKITARRFRTNYSNCIMFEDMSGIDFSFTIEKPFSTKNIIDFLTLKFKKVKIL